MNEEYPYPKELPEMFIDDDGVLNVLFGTILITANHIYHCVGKQRKMAPDQKLLVMIVGEAGTKIDSEIKKVSSSKWVADVSLAVALVTEKKVGWVMGTTFMALNNNPYPTKLFNNTEDAKAWLKQYR